MATKTWYAIADDGTTNELVSSDAGSDQYTMVDEAVADDVTTYNQNQVNQIAVVKTDLYTHTADDVPAGSTSISVTIYYKGAMSKSGGTVVNSYYTAGFDSGGTIYEDTHRNTDTTWTAYNKAYATNPNGGAAWTVAAVNAIKLMARCKGEDLGDLNYNQGRVTQVYAVVTYTEGAAGSESSSPSKSPSISSSLSASISSSVSVSRSPSASISPSKSASVSPSISSSKSNSVSPSVSPSKSNSISPSISASLSPSVSTSISPSVSQSASYSQSVSASVSPSISASKSVSISPSQSPSVSPSISQSVSSSVSSSVSPSISASVSASISESISESVSESVSESSSASKPPVPSSSPSSSPSKSLSPSEEKPSNSISPSASESISASLSASRSASRSISLSPSASISPSRSVSASPSPSESVPVTEGGYSQAGIVKKKQQNIYVKLRNNCYLNLTTQEFVVALSTSKTFVPFEPNMVDNFDFRMKDLLIQFSDNEVAMLLLEV